MVSCYSYHNFDRKFALCSTTAKSPCVHAHVLACDRLDEVMDDDGYDIYGGAPAGGGGLAGMVAGLPTGGGYDDMGGGGGGGGYDEGPPPAAPPSGGGFAKKVGMGLRQGLMDAKKAESAGKAAFRKVEEEEECTHDDVEPLIPGTTPLTPLSSDSVTPPSYTSLINPFSTQYGVPSKKKPILISCDSSMQR